MRTPRVFAADILRILNALPDSEHLAALQAAGYGLKADDENAKANTPAKADLAQIPEPPPDGRRLPPPQPDLASGFGPIFWRIAEDLPIPAAPRQRQAPDWLTAEPAHYDKRCFVSSGKGAADLPQVPLVSAERFARFVSDYLRPRLAGQVPDLPRAVDRLARGRHLEPMPRLARRKWPGCVQVVLDWSGVLTPFRADLLALLDQLRRLLDRRIEILLTENGEPDEWLTAPGFASRLRFDGSPLVVLGDGGAYRPGSGQHRRWAVLGQRLAAVGVRPLLLAPVPLRRLPDGLRETFDVVLLGEGASLRLLGGEPRLDSDEAQARSKKGLALLRAALFGNSHVSWRLVRQLRLALQEASGPDFAVDMGSEAELWQDAETCAVPTGCALAMEAVEPALARLQALRAAQPAEVDRLVDHHLVELSVGSPLLHAVFMSEVRRGGLVGDTPLIQAHGQKADALFVELARCLHGTPPGRDARELGMVLGEFIGGLSLRAPGAVGRGDEPLQTAWALARADAIRAGNVSLPPGLRLDRLDWLIQPDAPPPGPLHHVVASASTLQARGRVGLRIELVEAIGPMAAPSALIPNLEDELPVSIEPADAPGVEGRHLLVPGQALHLPGGQAYRIVTRRREVVIEPFERPEWAKTVRFVDGRYRAVCGDGRELWWVQRGTTVALRTADRGGVEAIAAAGADSAVPKAGEVGASGGSTVFVTASLVSAELSSAWRLPHGAWWDSADFLGIGLAAPDVAIPPWAVRHGVDELGFWAEFDVKGRSAVVTQRCRWIAPGTFQMGSPTDEVDRRDDETQHEVTLTRGYWLADTACTQALWQAVMGDNPSHFKDDPVEQVSWDDVQTFLNRLNALVPGLGAGLPNEAQWEYACRAGTSTPFSFGENITPEQVNYNGDVPYADGKEGPYRERIVPVKSLPPNPWGLYEMHGNVDEWCADRYGDYPQGPQIDPSGPSEGIDRVLRGGSWYFYGRNCRAANRNWFEPGYRNNFIGFRLAPGQRPGPAGQEAARRADGQAQAERAGQAAGSNAGGRGAKPRSRKGSKKP